MNQHLINLALALAAAELVHNIVESQSVREKVKRLQAAITGRPYKDPLPFSLNTRAKAYSFSLAGFALLIIIFYALFNWLNLSLDTALKTIVILLVVAYLTTVFLLDKYHVEIERVTKPFLKNKKK